MNYFKLTALGLLHLCIAACGSGDALDAVEQAANNINTAVTDLSTVVNDTITNATDELQSDQSATNESATTNNPAPAPIQTPTQTRPEISEDYQYSCSSFTDTNNIWVWSFRPDLNVADQFDLVIGVWEWVDNLQLLIRPQGNPEVLGTLSTADENTIFLENWGVCWLRFGRPLAQQFTRPN